MGIETVDTTELTEFVARFGSYLKMHTCLAYSGILRAQTVIIELLKLARHDPRHRQAKKQISEPHAMAIYEPVSPRILFMYSRKLILTDS